MPDYPARVLEASLFHERGTARRGLLVAYKLMRMAGSAAESSMDPVSGPSPALRLLFHTGEQIKREDTHLNVAP